MSETLPTATTTPEMSLSALALPPLELRSLDKKVVDAARYQPAQLEQAHKMAESVDFTDSNSVPLYASQAMQEFDRVLNQLLEGVRVEDTGAAGDMVLGVTRAMDAMRIKQMRAELKPWSFRWMGARFPVIGKYLSLFYYFYQRKQQFLKMTDEMERKAKGRVREILEYLIKSDKLISAVENQYNLLGLYILAGEEALGRGRTLLAKMSEDAARTGDAVASNRAHTMHEALSGFDTRLLHLKMAYAKAPVTGQQIRLGQSAGRTTLQNIQNTLDFTITDLKTTIVQVAGVYKMREGQKEAERIDKLEADVAGLSQGLLNETYLAAKRTEGDGLERVKRLSELMGQVADLTKQGMELDRQNAVARKEAESVLASAMEQYREAMGAINRPDPLA